MSNSRISSQSTLIKNRSALRLFDMKRWAIPQFRGVKKKKIFDRMHMFSRPELVRVIGQMIEENELVYRRQ